VIEDMLDGMGGVLRGHLHGGRGPQSISPGSGTRWLGGTFTMCFRNMTPP
jgi:hypothetical protein